MVLVLNVSLMIRVASASWWRQLQAGWWVVWKIVKEEGGGWAFGVSRGYHQITHTLYVGSDLRFGPTDYYL